MNPEPDTVPTDSYVADLSKLPNAVTSGDWTRRELFRRCMVEYPRCMHAATPEGRRLMLSRRPALTNTPWDAVVAASMEHSALLHGCDPPAWGDEPERFLDEPVELLDQWCRTVVCHLPAPFTRRGIIMDPRNLDRRTGDEQWSPEPGDPEVRWPRDDWLNSWVEQRAKLLYVQKPPTRPEPGRPQLYDACANIESEAARAGWVVRVSLSRTKPPATFVLRGPHLANARIRSMEPTEARALITRALEHVDLDERRWHGLLADKVQTAGGRAAPPPTVWNRPGLTVAGTATGVTEQWQNATPGTTTQS